MCLNKFGRIKRYLERFIKLATNRRLQGLTNEKNKRSEFPDLVNLLLANLHSLCNYEFLRKDKKQSRNEVNARYVKARVYYYVKSWN